MVADVADRFYVLDVMTQLSAQDNIPACGQSSTVSVR